MPFFSSRFLPKVWNRAGKLFGINAHGQDISLKINAISRSHAETDAFQQAFNAGAIGGRARLTVDRALCVSCGQNGGVVGLARQLGLEELEIFTPGAIRFIKP